jgi:hypothetical protein
VFGRNYINSVGSTSWTMVALSNIDPKSDSSDSKSKVQNAASYHQTHPSLLGHRFSWPWRSHSVGVAAPDLCVEWRTVADQGRLFRLFLRDARVDFEDVRYAYDDSWPTTSAELKEKGLSVTGKVPVLEYEGKVLRQVNFRHMQIIAPADRVQ